LNISTFTPNFSPPYLIDIYIVFDQTGHGEHESEVKTRTGSIFGRHSDEKPILGICWVFITIPLGIGNSLFGAMTSLIGLNIW